MNRRKIKFCECGCGEIVKKGNRFIHGHHNRDPSPELRKKLRRANRGKSNPFYGKTHSPEVREKIRKAKQGKNNPMYGKTHSSEAIEKMSKSQRGENNHNWQGGASNYGQGFTNALKEKIRKRDGYTCQCCDVKQKNLSRRLDVHHIDYNKKNHNEVNLISLCRSCHSKTDFNRKEWQKCF